MALTGVMEWGRKTRGGAGIGGRGRTYVITCVFRVSPGKCINFGDIKMGRITRRRRRKRNRKETRARRRTRARKRKKKMKKSAIKRKGKYTHKEEDEEEKE